jgi:cell shape-determining protein MreD
MMPLNLLPKIQKKVPLLTLLVSILLDDILYHLSSQTFLFLTLPTFFYWAIYQPKHLPYISLFFISFLQDAWNHFPLGITYITYMYIFFFTRFLKQLIPTFTFSILWASFGICLITCFALQHFIFVHIAHIYIPLSTFYSAGIYTFLLYPWISLALNTVNFRRARI